MKVESISVQGVGLMNEDAVLIQNPVFAVFDGATSLSKYINKEGKTGGWLAAHLAKNIFSQSTLLLIDTIKQANTALRGAMIKCGIDTSKKEELWCTAVAAVQIRDAAFDWARLSDCLAVVIYKDATYKVLGSLYDHDTSWLAVWKNFPKKPSTSVWDAVPQEILNVRKQMNVSYGCLNGEPEALSFVEKGTEKLDTVAHILLMSDGFLIPKKDPLVQTDIGLLVNIFLNGGLKGVQEYVRDIENTDPKCFTYPRVKKHDDMSAIAISF